MCDLERTRLMCDPEAIVFLICQGNTVTGSRSHSFYHQLPKLHFQFDMFPLSTVALQAVSHRAVALLSWRPLKKGLGWRFPP